MCLLELQKISVHKCHVGLHHFLSDLTAYASSAAYPIQMGLIFSFMSSTMNSEKLSSYGFLQITFKRFFPSCSVQILCSTSTHIFTKSSINSVCQSFRIIHSRLFSNKTTENKPRQRTTEAPKIHTSDVSKFPTCFGMSQVPKHAAD